MDWSYVAGFLDGEGSICVPEVDGVLRRIEVKMCQSQAGLNALEAISTFLADNEIHSVLRKVNFNYDRNPFYELTVVREDDCVELIENIIDLLIVKKDRAQVALDKWYFKQELKREFGRFFRRPAKLALRI